MNEKKIIRREGERKKEIVSYVDFFEQRLVDWSCSG
jgi:hypothetical protein